MIAGAQVEIVSDQRVDALDNIGPCQPVYGSAFAKRHAAGVVHFIRLIRAGHGMGAPAFAVMLAKK